MTAVYEDVIFALDAVPAPNRVLRLGVVLVRQDFRYDTQIVAKDETRVFVDKTHTVYPGTSRNILGGGPFATLVFKVSGAGGTAPATGVSLAIKTPSGEVFSGTTDASGEATIQVRGLTDRTCTLTAAGDQIAPSPLPLPLVGAREGLVEYQIKLQAR
jgi:hypothetical protein